MDEQEIVLIEDNANDAELTKLALKKLEFPVHVEWLRDGADAIEHFRSKIASDPSYVRQLSLVFLDLKMPKVNGFEVLQTLKTLPELVAVPIVVLTSSAVESDIEEAYKLGANSYIVKPINYKQHAQEIRDAAVYWTTINKTLS